MDQVIKAKFTIKAEEKDNHGKFVVEPLQQGYGHTVGNAVRRCLLSSLSGAAITRIKIDGAKHKFSTLKGMKEDVIEFILNLKKIRFAYEEEDELKIELDARGPGEVKAGDIKTPAELNIVNPELKLATLADKKSRLKVQMWVNVGYGYSPGKERQTDTVGIIPIDAIFSPIIRVTYKVEATRVGRRTDFDKLIMEIWTDGTVKPKTTLEKAAKILEGFFRQIYKPVFEEEEEGAGDQPELANGMLKLTVEELSLPTRIANALRRGGYGTVKDLAEASEEDIIGVKNLGKKSLKVIREKLADKGIELKK